MAGMTAPVFQNMKLRRRWHRLAVYILLLIGFVWFAFPLIWMLLGSVKTYADLTTIPPRVWPTTFRWSNYPEAWTIVPFTRYFINTAIITVVSILGIIISCSLVGYGFARLQFWGRNVAFMLMISTMMLPSWVTVIPQFLLFNTLGWIDTWYPLIVPSFFGVPAYIFLMRQFFLTLPLELDEAAELDGCSQFGIYWRILMPLCKPVLATITIFTFIGQWNEFFSALIYIHRPELYTIAIGLAFLRNAISLDSGEPVQALLLAAGVFTSLPLLFIFFFGQKYFVQGIALTGRTGM